MLIVKQSLWPSTVFLFEHASEKLLLGHKSGNFPAFIVKENFMILGASIWNHFNFWSDFDNFVNQNFAYGPHSNSSTSPFQRHLPLYRRDQEFLHLGISGCDNTFSKNTSSCKPPIWFETEWFWKQNHLQMRFGWFLNQCLSVLAIVSSN